MRVVRIRHMGMRVPHRLVMMGVAMRTGRHRVMGMLVVTIVMTVRMFVLGRLVLVRVTM
jgi:hypothetical protein